MFQLVTVPLLIPTPQLQSTILASPIGFALPTEPQVEIEYDFECDAPSANDTCDGRIRIFAWLHVTSRRQLDGSSTWILDRRILPQRFELTWKLDTGAVDILVPDHIEECRPPAWSDSTEQFKGAANTDAGGYAFSHVTPVKMDPDPANDSGSGLTATTKFAWRSVLISLGNAQVVVGGPIIGGSGQATIGVQERPYNLNVVWRIDILGSVNEAERSESAETILSPTLDQDLYCNASSSGGILRKGEGKGVYAAPNGILNNDRLEKS